MPSTAPGTIYRRRWITTRTFAPVLFIGGAIATAGFFAGISFIKELPHGVWNLVPFLIVLVVGSIGFCMVAFAIGIQSALVRAHKGLDVSQSSGDIERNITGAMLLAVGFGIAVVTHFSWLPAIDLQSALLDEIQRRQLVIRILCYWPLLSAVIRTGGPDATTLMSGKVARRLASAALVVGFIIFNATLKRVLPLDYAVERFIGLRGEGLAENSREALVPLDLWHGELVALIGLSLAITVSITLIIAWALGHRNDGDGRQPSVWAGAILLAVCAAIGWFHGTQSPPPGARGFELVPEFMLPLGIGMAAIGLSQMAGQLVRAARAAVRRTQSDALEILLAILALGIALAALYALSQMSAARFAVLVLGAAAAVVVGLLDGPAGDPQTAHSTSTST